MFLLPRFPNKLRLRWLIQNFVKVSPNLILALLYAIWEGGCWEVSGSPSDIVSVEEMFGDRGERVASTDKTEEERGAEEENRKLKEALVLRSQKLMLLKIFISYLPSAERLFQCG